MIYLVLLGLAASWFGFALLGWHLGADYGRGAEKLDLALRGELKR